MPLRAAFDAELEHLERAYATNPYAGGQTATLADFASFVYLATAHRLGHPLRPALLGFHDPNARAVVGRADLAARVVDDPRRSRLKRHGRSMRPSA